MRTIETISRGEIQAEQAKKELVEANLRLVVSITVHEPRPAVPRPDPGRQHRPDEGGRQVRVSPRLQVLDLRDLVDPPGHHPRDCGPGADDPHPGAHDRDDQQADSHIAPLVQELGRGRPRKKSPSAWTFRCPKVRKVLKIAQEPISLETPIGEEEDSHLGDFIEDRQVVSPSDAVINLNLKEQTDSVLKTLTPREEERSSRCGSVSATAASTRSKRWARALP